MQILSFCHSSSRVSLYLSSCPCPPFLLRFSFPRPPSFSRSPTMCCASFLPVQQQPSSIFSRPALLPERSDGTCAFAAVRVFGIGVCWFEDLKGAEQVCRNVHDGCSVVKLSAVIRCRKQRNQLPCPKELVAVLHHLVRTCNQVKLVKLQELLHNLWPERERDTTVVFSPRLCFLIWICPQPVLGTSHRRHSELQASVNKYCRANEHTKQTGKRARGRRGHKRPGRGERERGREGRKRKAYKSQSKPVSGTSVGRWMDLIWSIVCKSGERPPWQQKILLATTAATGKQLKQSVNVFQILMLYLRLHSS